MLGKLIKYDLKFGKAPFLAMAGGLLFVGVIGRMLGLGTIMEVGIIAMLCIVAIAVGCVVLVFQNYSRSMFADEGYLTLTLPVKRHKLILSKLIVSAVWFCVMALAIFLAILIMFGGDFIRSMSRMDAYDILNLILGAFQFFLMAVNVILLLYAAITTANVSIKGRRLGWPVALTALSLAVVLEIQLEALISRWVFGGRYLWMVRENGSRAISLIFNADAIENYNNYISCFIINQSTIITMILVSVLAFIISWRLLMKRVDLT